MDCFTIDEDEVLNDDDPKRRVRAKVPSIEVKTEIECDEFQADDDIIPLEAAANPEARASKQFNLHVHVNIFYICACMF
jgi:hypothetical protein